MMSYAHASAEKHEKLSRFKDLCSSGAGRGVSDVSLVIDPSIVPPLSPRAHARPLAPSMDVHSGSGKEAGKSRKIGKPLTSLTTPCFRETRRLRNH